MAKGVIKGQTGGMGNSVFVSTNTPANTTKVGDTISISGNLTPDITEGDTVNFDIVQGPPDPTGLPSEVASNVTLSAKGELITTNRSGTITIAAGQSKVIRGTLTIDGKINVTGGALIISGNVTIDGKIEGNAGGFITLDNGVKVDGKVETISCKVLAVKACTVDGKISSNGDTTVRICNNSIKGKLEVTNAGTCMASGNVVDGQSTLPANTVPCA